MVFGMTKHIESLDQAIALLEKQRSHLMKICQQDNVGYICNAVNEAFSQCGLIGASSNIFRTLATGDFSFVSLIGTTVPQALKVSADHYHVELELESDCGMLKFTADVIEHHSGLTRISALDITLNDSLVEPTLDVFLCIEGLIANKLMHQPEQDQNTKGIFNESKIYEIIDLINSSAENIPNNNSNVYEFNVPARTA